MEEIKLPRHLIDSVERRWMNKLEQAAHAWKSDQQTRPILHRVASGEGQRHIPVVMRRRTGNRSGTLAQGHPPVRSTSHSPGVA